MSLPTIDDRQPLLDALDTLTARTKTMAEAAAHLGVSNETVRRMIERGQLDIVKVGNMIRVWADGPEFDA